MAVRLARQRGLLSSLICPPSLSTAASLRSYSTDLPEKEESKEEKSQSLTETESKEVVAADVVSGTPERLKFRTVRIFKPTRTAMQSGTHNTKQWRIDFDILEGGGRWENPLMGWMSSADPVQAIQMKFATKEDAIFFAEKQGWDYYVQEQPKEKFVKKMYADNYKYSPGKLRIIKTK
ncbi:5275_t:CDS:2 [Paraglomus occultum]|uniref:NADH dehydrogenase [ubiquinone] iron-sulfur protein 4, mitochondrial n=1 Tax=Paraglomus occultum TaxID=144539 RepID=A0A9N8YVN3_9GLOM|nr:5275_t:CDS:2 [Paraglomus occultum]